jgi:hypothetical protein
VIAQACESFEGPLEPPFDPDGCSLAEYFTAKGEAALCEAAFCNRCARKDTGCGVLGNLRGRAPQETAAAA